MTNVREISEKQKKFIPNQVRLHNKAIDILGLLQKCTNKITLLKKQITNIDADTDLLPECAVEGISEVRRNVVYLHNSQVMVYRRILSYYLNTLAKCYTPDFYDHMDFLPWQPNALKNVTAEL